MFVAKAVAVALMFAGVTAEPVLEPVSDSPGNRILDMPPPTALTFKGTTPQSTSPSTITSFRLRFTPYEKRIRFFIENMRREYLTMNTDCSKFLDELDTYMDQLPTNKTKWVPKKFRSRCYCEGQTWTPCPERCIDSCYAPNNRPYTFDNCSQRSVSTCYCYDGSSTRCDGGTVNDCYQERLELVADTQPCLLNSTADQHTIKEAFSRFLGLLVEPLKILVRGLEFKLTSLKQSVVATDIVTNITSQLCEVNEPTCLSEAAGHLSQKLNNFWQLKKNITLDMIKIQNKAESVAKDVDVLKEQTLNQINKSIKEYTCCLKGLKFTVKDNDCTPKPVVIPTTAPTHGPGKETCPYSTFQCDNQRCVAESWRCDGTNDCGDNSDEVDCLMSIV